MPLWSQKKRSDKNQRDTATVGKGKFYSLINVFSCVFFGT